MPTTEFRPFRRIRIRDLDDADIVQELIAGGQIDAVDDLAAEGSRRVAARVVAKTTGVSDERAADFVGWRARLLIGDEVPF